MIDLELIITRIILCKDCTYAEQIGWAPVLYMKGGFIMFGGWLGQKNNVYQESNIIARFDESTFKWSKVVFKVPCI